MKRLVLGALLVCMVALIAASGCRRGDTGDLPVSSCTVAEDQTITIDGRSVGIDDFVEMVKQRSPTKVVTFEVTPESKIKRETLEEIARRLHSDGYTVQLARAEGR